jgi:cytochrome c peroxidase
VPPLFGGTRPTDFAIAVYASLGTPRQVAGGGLDPDRGRAGVTGDAADEGAFKTPTLREVSRTAPYFHHGAFPTLESVVDFYDRGGGSGLGLKVPNQDPDVRPLKLTPKQRQELLIFMRNSLTDAPAAR